MSRYGQMFESMFRGWDRVSTYRDTSADTWHVHLEVSHQSLMAGTGPAEVINRLYPKRVTLPARTGVRFHGRRVGKQ